MADWLKVFRINPDAVVVLVNERGENPDSPNLIIRSELRYRGRQIVQSHVQNTPEELAKNFALLDMDRAVQWVINLPNIFKEGGLHCGR
jgi:hypothetical protein